MKRCDNSTRKGKDNVWHCRVLGLVEFGFGYVSFLLGSHILHQNNKSYLPIKKSQNSELGFCFGAFLLLISEKKQDILIILQNLQTIFSK